MSAANASTKFLLSLGALISVVVAGTFSDLRFNSNDFMFEDNIVVKSYQEEEVSNRIVASAERELPSAQYIAYNSFNRTAINGDWKITKIYNTNQSIVFDQNRIEDKDLTIDVEFEMIATSLIRIDGDKGLDFEISFVHESGTRIALFRSMDEGYEVIEAKRYKKKVIKALATSKKRVKKKKVSPKKIVKSKGGVKLDRDVDLILERALDPKHNKNVVMGNAISGTLSLLGGNIENLDVTIHKGTDKEVSQNVPFIQINNGGQFSFEGENGMVSGIITNNGKDGYRIRFATGVFAGAMLNFVTEDEFDNLLELQEKIDYEKMIKQEEIAEQRELQKDEQQEKQEEKRAAQALKVEEESSRERAKYDNSDQESGEENDEIEEIETEEDIALKVKKSGFSFAQGRSKSLKKTGRSIASIPTK